MSAYEDLLAARDRMDMLPGAQVRHKNDTHLGIGVILNRPWSQGQVPCWFPDGPHRPLPFIPYRYCLPEMLTVVRDD